MHTTVKISLLKSAFGDRALELVPGIRWRNDTQRVDIELNDFTRADLDVLIEKGKEQHPAFARRAMAWRDLRLDPTGNTPANLKELVMVLRDHIAETCPHKFVFTLSDGGDEQMLPYYVTNIQYVPAERTRYGYTPPYVKMEMSAMRDGDRTNWSCSWHDHDLVVGKKASEYLTQEDVFAETPEAFAKWEAELKTFLETYRETGVQFLGVGYCEYNQKNSGWWSTTKKTSLVVEGRPSRLVVDHFGDAGEDTEGKESSGSVVDHFWDPVKPGVDADDLSATQQAKRQVALPVHPYIQMFNFEMHRHINCHISCLQKYVYNVGLEKKLILPPDFKDLIGVLIGTAANMMEDIVSGKTGGVIVICTGYPGTGKTLTAEVYSEQIQRPLYMVQCSQLGTDAESLETELVTVLKRASRWNAVLLIDEADVYVRARGDDLMQNAIVGVFLRVLERYRGVLFMTSNRATAIDDAVLSRAIAHLRYELPDAKSLDLIWEVLGENYDVSLMPAERKDLVETYPGISGRNVKTLLKLATSVAKKKEGEDYKKGEIVKLIKKVAPFVDFPKPETRSLPS